MPETAGFDPDPWTAPGKPRLHNHDPVAMSAGLGPERPVGAPSSASSVSGPSCHACPTCSRFYFSSSSEHTATLPHLPEAISAYASPASFQRESGA